jgi:hypothetical protein
VDKVKRKSQHVAVFIALSLVIVPLNGCRKIVVLVEWATNIFKSEEAVISASKLSKSEESVVSASKLYQSEEAIKYSQQLFKKKLEEKSENVALQYLYLNESNRSIEKLRIILKDTVQKECESENIEISNAEKDLIVNRGIELAYLKFEKYKKNSISLLS